MPNTPPKPPIADRPSEVILEDLCLALRRVGVNDSSLPNGDGIAEDIKLIQELNAELVRRGYDSTARLNTLSQETGWLIPELLEDCLRFPAVLPFVREPDGIRRTLRCQLCKKAERPRDAQLFWFCDECMWRVAESTRTREPINRIVLFRTFNPECRCAHADSETVLVTEYYADVISGVCARCVEEELRRRRSKGEGK